MGKKEVSEDFAEGRVTRRNLTGTFLCWDASGPMPFRTQSNPDTVFVPIFTSLEILMAYVKAYENDVGSEFLVASVVTNGHALLASLPLQLNGKVVQIAMDPINEGGKIKYNLVLRGTEKGQPLE